MDYKEAWKEANRSSSVVKRAYPIFLGFVVRLFLHLMITNCHQKEWVTLMPPVQTFTAAA